MRVGATSNSIRSEMGCRARCPGVGCGCGIGGTSTGGGRGLGGTGDGLWIGPGSGVGPGTCTPKAMTAPLSDRATRRPALVVFSILVENAKARGPHGSVLPCQIRPYEKTRADECDCCCCCWQVFPRRKCGRQAPRGHLIVPSILGAMQPKWNRCSEPSPTALPQTTQRLGR